MKAARALVSSHKKITAPRWAVPCHVGALTKRCKFCAALHFPEEKERCCDKGKVKLPEPRKPEYPLDELLEGTSKRAKAHRKWLSALNTLFSYASRQYVKKEVAGRGVPIRKIRGTYSHAVSGINPREDTPRQFGSLYVLDDQTAIIEERLKNPLTQKMDAEVRPYLIN